MIALLETLLGTPPVGYEHYEYLFAGILAVLFAVEVTRLFRMVLGAVVHR